MKKILLLSVMILLGWFLCHPAFCQFENEEEDNEEVSTNDGGSSSLILTQTTYDWVDHVDPEFFETDGGSIRGDDAADTNINIGFTFSYYGIEYNRINLSTNGFATLGDNTRNLAQYITPSSLPSAGAPHTTLAVFWDDLVAYSAAIAYETIEDPERGLMFVATWEDMSYFSSWWFIADNITFQLILHETGDITMQYKNVPDFSAWTGDSDDGTDSDDDDAGSGANGPIPLVGLENEDSSQGYNFNGSELEDQMAISTFQADEGTLLYREPGTDRQGNQLASGDSGFGCFISTCLDKDGIE